MKAAREACLRCPRRGPYAVSHRKGQSHEGIAGGTGGVFVVFFFFSNEVLHIFMENSIGDAIRTGTAFLRIVSPFYLVISIKLIADGMLRGSSAMLYFMTSTFTDLILRVILAYIFAGFFGSVGIWISWPVGWSVSAVLSLVFYRMEMKKLKLHG